MTAVRITWAKLCGSIMAAALLAWWPQSAMAQQRGSVAFSLGYFDINKQDDGAAEGRVEYRFAENIWLLKPLAGVMATSDGGLYGYGGFGIDLPLGSQVVATPSLAAGLYNDGGGKDLGHTIEFRSQLELSYQLADRSRIAISFSHMSNAGLGAHNPGANTVAITYILPAARLFGR